jgi:hypothetical protein
MTDPEPTTADQELDDLLTRANAGLLAELDRVIDTEASLREVLRRAGCTHDQNGEPFPDVS